MSYVHEFISLCLCLGLCMLYMETWMCASEAEKRRQTVAHISILIEMKEKRWEHNKTRKFSG